MLLPGSGRGGSPRVVEHAVSPVQLQSCPIYFGMLHLLYRCPHYVEPLRPYAAFSFLIRAGG